MHHQVMHYEEKQDSQSHILRLNIAGSPVEWLTWQEATTLYARELVTWTLGDTIRTVWGGTSRFTGERSTIALQSIIACAGELRRSALRLPVFAFVRGLSELETRDPLFRSPRSRIPLPVVVANPTVCRSSRSHRSKALADGLVSETRL